MATIAVDIDDVLIPFFELFADWYNSQFGTSFRADMLPTTRLSIGWGGQEAHWIEQCNAFHQDVKRGSSTIPIEPDAKRALSRLKTDGHRLKLVTSRPAMHRTLAEQWVDRNLDGIVDELHMCESTTANGGSFHMKKGELCRQIDASVLIDDNENYIQDARRQRVHGLLFGDHPWNRSSLHPCRAYSWHQAIAHLNSEACMAI